jgi:hypothetical protein
MILQDNLLSQLWTWAKDNDAPNWLILVFTGILWPTSIWMWNRKKVNNVPNLDVRLRPSNIIINGTNCDAVEISFANHTGSVVYITGPRLIHCSEAFLAHSSASRNIADDSYELLFADPSNNFSEREQTLQTNDSAITSMATSSKMDVPFFSYTASWFMRLIRRRKYFVLEYTVVVGTNRRFVATLY